MYGDNSDINFRIEVIFESTINLKDKHSCFAIPSSKV